VAHRNRRSVAIPLVLSAVATLAACGEVTPPAIPPVATIPVAPAVTKKPAKPAVQEVPMSVKVSRFVPAKLTADVDKLPKGERAALDKLIAAAKLLDPVFDRQAYAGYAALREQLAADTSAEGKDKLAYFDIMRGPWDRQEHYHPFAIDTARPPGAGFYPPDLTADAFKAYVAAHPDQKKALESLTTVVVRKGDKLEAIPYSKAYAEWLAPAAKLMQEAAKLTRNGSLKKFLKSRADAFLSDDYYQSDKDWMDLDSLVEITIGPYETYEDDLFGYKAAFEAFVTVSDPKASKKLSGYKKLLPAMEKNLPIPDAVKTKRGAESPIRVVDLVFTSGDARKSVQTIAFNLPNDERVRAEKGAKKVMLRNIIETKFDLIMRPIAERIIDPAQTRYLSSEAFFNETLFHELSHSLGPAFTKKDGKKVEVRIALEAASSALEEGKADVMGAYNILFMIKKGEFPKDFREKLLLSYFAGLFRSTRFGVSEAHGKGAAMQINRFLEEGAAKQGADGKFTVDFDKLEASIGKLVHDICMIQHAGDKAAAEALLGKYGVMSEPMKKALGGLDDIPVDVKPIYPVAGE
jgi:predicted small lipoprotein YifL